MKKLSIFLVITAFSFFGLSESAFPQLSPQAQSDVLQKKIVQSLKQKDFKKANKLFEEYDDLGVKMPTPLLLVRAQVSFKANDFVAAKTHLEQYINAAQRGTPNYNKALAMYEQVESKAKTQLAEQQRLQKAKQRAEKAKQRAEKLAAFQQKIDQARSRLAQTNVLPNMLPIPAGRFQMGSDESSDEQPIHTVNISAFKMADTETTQALWQAVMGKNRSYFKGVSRPVDSVSWDDVQDFIIVLNSATEQKFRLPTEAEWEYAARGGTTTKYNWGNSPSKRKANYGVSSKEGTKPVKSYKPNAFGLYDMHGNVWEWVQDCYQDTYTGASDNGIALEVCDTKYRVLRGGSFSRNADIMRSASRVRNSRVYRYGYNGFRLAQDN